MCPTRSERGAFSGRPSARGIVAMVAVGTLLIALVAVLVWRLGQSGMLERAQAIWRDDPEQARQLLEACEPDELIELAVDAQASGRWPLAEMALSAANRPGPQQQTVVRMLISVHYETESDQAVLEHCHQLAQLAPQDPFPWLVAAGIYHENENAALALDAYRQALQRDPPGEEVPRVRYQIAELSLYLGDVGAARQQVDLLLAEQGAVEPVQLLHAKLLRREGQAEAALRVVQEVLANSPASLPALTLRGQCYFDLQQFPQAVEDLRRVVRAEPYNYRVHYKLGQAYLRLDQPELSATHLGTSRRLTDHISEILRLEDQLEQDPGNRELRLRLAELNEQLGNTDRAETWRRSAQPVP